MLNYSIVDVFSEGKYTGNPLAVFRNAGNLSDAEMQQIAKEINYSETTFIVSESITNNYYDVRIFTPKEEIPFAGHPALGTAYVIQSEILTESVEKVILNFKGGQIPVTFNPQEGVLWMTHNEPIFGRILDAHHVLDVLNVAKEDIDSRFPIQEVSTGLPDIIVPLKSLEAVRKVKLNSAKYFDLINQTEAKAIMVFAPETYHSVNDLNVRDFAEYYGIPEDPATGSSNGCLAAYLVKYRYFDNNKINIRVEQGYEMERPSLLFLRASDDHGIINVCVGGRVVKVAQGEWFV
ncbi:PhzF family phenazine biosynthesis protein [Paenibacillus zeisoli]|uniref:PhzF family phenazine biosynthesis protein n=2 Tax=Paenibacillus zeisoli TaxID=2496267 RepID=A0A3S1BBG8_9BACL|nr:PhzF family phenazine biosynthesis protein [Paenibacillus zeisoli]